MCHNCHSGGSREQEWLTWVTLVQGLSRSGSGVRQSRGFPKPDDSLWQESFPLLVLAGGLASVHRCLSVLPAWQVASPQ